MIDHQDAALADHITAYLLKLEAEGTSPVHRDNVRRALHRLAADCQFKRLGHLAREALERWLVTQEKAGMGPRTRNTYRSAAVAFCNWAVATGRMLSNPFSAVAKADENTDRRRQRRALSEAELTALLDVARRRPLVDAMTIRRGSRKGQVVAKLREETRRRLERLGHERGLIYKTLVLTGLRKGELASITVGQLALDADPPRLRLAARDAKNRHEATIPLRADVAADLRQWLAEKASAHQEAAGESQTVRFDPNHQKPSQRHLGDSEGRVGQMCQALTAVPPLPANTPLFTVPRDLVRILDRDLKLAKIPKQDELGRTVDVHAMRHSFATHLAKTGAFPRTAQAAMRHSDVNLTMGAYTDPRLLDVAGALDALPALPLDGVAERERIAVSATGTNDSTPRQFAPKFAPTPGKPCKLLSSVVKMTADERATKEAGPTAVSACAVNKKKPLTTGVNGSQKERETGFEPATSSLGSNSTRVVSDTSVGNETRRQRQRPPRGSPAARRTVGP
ncbi:MAG: site-specific integrase [Planctomycetia bacterium]|nr:site-specific integrase [Planctomycetia bacterium]